MTKTTIQTVVGAVIVLIIGAVLGAFLVGTATGEQTFSGTTFDESNLVGDVYQGQTHVLMMQDGVFVGPIDTASNSVTVGTNGTALSAIKTGSATIWAPAQTIAATSSQQVELQSATDGSLASGLTGITADSICHVTMASSTNTTLGTLVVGGASASSTAGSIVARIVNLTGTTFTWDATASSSAKWKYTCFDPA